MSAIEEMRKESQAKRLDNWILWAITAEAFLIAIHPEAAKAALLVGILLTLWKKHKHKEMKFRHLPFDVPVALFVLLGAASILVSPDRGFSFYNYYNLVGVYALTYLLIGQNVRCMAQVKRIAGAFVIALVGVLLYGYFQFIFGIDISAMRWVDGEAFPELSKRVFSTWENPNIFAGYLDMAICVLLGVFVKCEGRVRKTALFILMILSTICLGMTYARGACLTIAVVLVLYGMFKDWRILFACVFVGGAVLAFDTTLCERLFSVFTKVDTSSEMRLAFWEATITMIQDHPFLGIGWGAYWMVYPKYDFYMQGEYIKIVHAHNIYLNYMAEIGIAGALSFFWYFFGTMLTALRAKIFSVPVTAEELPLEELSLEESQKETALKPEKIEENAETSEEENASKQDASAEETEKTSDEESTAKEKDASDGDEKKSEEADAKDAAAEEKEQKDTEKKETVGKAAEENMPKPAAEKKKLIVKEMEIPVIQPAASAESVDSVEMKENPEVPSEASAPVDCKKELTCWDSLRLRAGMVLGIGLSFISVALNGLTDDLLFNIPTSMLLWMLAALAMVCVYMEDEVKNESTGNI